MKDSPSTSADRILSTLNQVFNKKTNEAGIDAIADGELNSDDLPTIAEAEESRQDNADLDNSTSPERDTIANRMLHDDIFKDPWEKGRAMFFKEGCDQAS